LANTKPRVSKTADDFCCNLCRQKYVASLAKGYRYHDERKKIGTFSLNFSAAVNYHASTEF